MSRLRVLIVGGGIAGNTLAIALGRQGIESEIAEINADWSVSGMGLSLTGPAFRALREIDLFERCIEEGFGVSQITNCDAHGNVLAVVDVPRLNGPDYPAMGGILRPVLHDMLRESVEAVGVTARLGITISQLDQRTDRVQVGFTDGTSGDYDLVVGADGIHSRVRRLVFGDGLEPRFTGQVVWRAVVPRPPEVDSLYQFYGPRIKTGCNPISAKEMYVFLVENTDDPSRRPRDRLPELMRAMLADFTGIAGDAREQIVHADQIVQRPIETILVAPPWHCGRVLLIGDAAHASPPHLASGGAVAIEDSIALAEMLDSGDDVDDVLESFTDRRFERCRMVVDNSVQLGEWERNPDDPAEDVAGLMNESFVALAQPF